MKSSVLAGRSRRLSALCSLILATQLTACGGDDDGGNAVVPPPPPAATKVKLTLTGAVTDEPIANANVTATIGTETFTATADASGSYSLDVEIDEADTDEFITLTAKGVGDQGFVEFTSLAGSFAALTAQAGTDKTLSNDENFSTQITNVSTAEAVLLKDANGGEPVTSDATLQSLGSSINAQDVLDLAAAIKLAVDDAENYPLPEGQTSILALASDSAARQAFINETFEADPAAFAAAQQAIAQDPDLSQAVNVQDVESFTAGLLSSDADFSFNYSGRVMLFDFEEGGTGTVSTDTFDQSMTWAVEGSTIRVAYASPVETVSFDTENCVGDGGVRQVEAHYLSEGVTIAFLNERTVAITTVSDVTYADCGALAPREDISTVARTVLSMDNFQVIDAEELQGATQTIYVYDSAQQAVVADIATLAADGTGTTRLLNLSFTWALDSTGKIVQAQFNDGATAEYLSLRDIDDVASDLFWEISTPGDGPVYIGAGATVFADLEYAVTFTAEDVPGRFYQFGVGEEGVDDARLKGFRLRFDENLMGAQEYDFIDENDAVVTVDETDESWNGFRWTLDGNEVVVRRTWDTVARVETCLFGEPNCIVYDERRIIPLAMVATRVYWVEQRRMDDVVTADTPPTQLVRFYDYEPLTGAAVSGSAKTRIASKVSKPRALLRGPGLR